MDDERYEYKVLFMMTGLDHDGYCSGEDEDSGNPVGPEKITLKVVRNSPNITTLNDFDFTEDGCSSHGGSGYCNNMYRHYRALRILKVTEILSTEEKLQQALQKVDQLTQELQQVTKEKQDLQCPMRKKRCSRWDR
jgi:hypothetical protein